MSVQDLSKSKIAQIEALTKSIQFSFASENDDLYKEMDRLIGLIIEEKESREKLRELAFVVANKI